MKAEAWIAWKLLFSRKTFVGGSAPLSLVGLCLGVASLVAAMGVMSGFERSLQQAMSDVTGHVQVIKRTRGQDDWRELEDKIKKAEPELVSSARFLRVEALLARAGRIQGVFLQSVDADRRDQVMNLRSRLVAGSLSMEPDGDVPAVLIGRGIASKFQIKPGDRLRLVVPIADAIDPEKFRRKMGEFIVRGTVDLGKHDWNERFLLADLAPVQRLAETGDRYQGLLLKFQDAERARESGFRLSQQLGIGYYVADWREMNEYLFEAVKLERVVIFFVVFIIVVVAAFNVASTLFVNVLRRTEDIALLKALGLSTKATLRLFSLQGLAIGVAGFIGGTALGWLICQAFTFLQGRFQLMSGAVYKLETIEASVRGSDLAVIALATIGICFVATFAPAWRGSRLTPTEGLRNG
ncbi:MAG: ABC transporter permease [Bdellovibrionaceae bacterium]|nr:ABC transporter permease [Pseudobdellovibrionaceae bacterium]